MNNLEAHLRSWVPRHPSAKLEQRLFARRRAAAESPPAFRLSWLAPAMAAMLLVCLFFNQHNAATLGPDRPGPMIASLVSNQSAAYLPGRFAQGENRLPADSYEWTIRRGATSVINAVFDSKKTDY